MKAQCVVNSAGNIVDGVLQLVDGSSQLVDGSTRLITADHVPHGQGFSDAEGGPSREEAGSSRGGGRIPLLLKLTEVPLLL